MYDFIIQVAATLTSTLIIFSLNKFRKWFNNISKKTRRIVFLLFYYFFATNNLVILVKKIINLEFSLKYIFIIFLLMGSIYSISMASNVFTMEMFNNNKK